MISQKTQSQTLNMYIPATTDVDQQDKVLYETLLAQILNKNIREQLRIYKRIIQDPQNQLKPLVKKYLSQHILAQFIFGSSALRHQVLDVIKILGVQTINISQLLKKLTSIQHYRNLSQILQSLPYKDTKQFKDHFFIPLLKSYTESTVKIQQQNFSCKWLQTFLEIVRAINNCIKYYPINEQDKCQILLLTKRILHHYLILRRDIMTHLFTIILSLNKDEVEPEGVLQKIHYLHAKAVLYAYPILGQLIKYTTITQTQIKYHLLYVFQYALDQEIETYQNKQQLFTAVVDLYEIGRSAYNIIENMIKVIVKAGGKWKIDGYLSRNFFVVKSLLKCPNVALKDIVSSWPLILKQSIQYAGNLSTPVAIDCVQQILLALYQQHKDNLEEWINEFYPDYFNFLLHGQKLTVRGIIDSVNPLIVRISKKPILLERLLSQKQISDNKQLGIISLLQCHKQMGMMIALNEQKSYTFKEYPTLKITYQKLSDLLISNQPNISCKALEFISVALKLTEPVLPFEYDLIFDYIKYSLGTNSSEYRQRYLDVFKKFFERLRGIYERQLIPTKKSKNTPYFKQTTDFLVKLINNCAQTLYPQVPFEVTCPALQIWLMVLNYFGVYDYEIKKTNILQGCDILRNKQVFTLSYFVSVALLLQSSFDNIRSLALNILYKFPSDFEFNVQQLWNECLKITNKLVIRQFESGCRLLAYIYDRYGSKIKGIQNKYKLPELNFYYYLHDELRKRFAIFKQEFIVQSQRFYENLIHGIATTLSYMFDKLSEKINKNKELISQHSEEIQKFLVTLFQTMIQILNFAVDISGTNVSTVVLDSTQSVNKISGMKIDCRGHFYPEDKNNVLKNIDKMLGGSTLMSSMDDEENPASQNTLVVSFYLVSKQLGLLFNSIVSIVEVDKEEKIIPEKTLVQLINSFFYALVNLKHMGSIDRISKGLQRMSKVLYRKDSQQLITIPQNLLKKLLQLLEDNKFTNILRRSAGVPYAFTCLLKSDALRKRQLVNETITTLFKFTTNQNKDQLQTRIHAYNILKKLFQDSDLKYELDPFVSEGFIRSIKGFGTEDWGVRNSSLMLFSALALRVLGPKPRHNLLEFFKKCPSLIDFFETQLKSYIQHQVMYPPIYPIALLLSRMIPFDQVKSPPNIDSHQQQPKQIHRGDFNKFIPLLQQAGNTPNCMGRIIIAKALFPFMQMRDILPFCLETLNKLSVQTIKTNHNQAHSRLMNVCQLLNSYYDLLAANKNQKFQNLQQSQIQLLFTLNSKLNILTELKCAFVQEIFCRIIYRVLNERISLLKQQLIFTQFITNFKNQCQQYLSKNHPLKRFTKDLGNSTYRITLLKTFLKLSQFLYTDNPLIQFQSFFSQLDKQSVKNNKYLAGIDFEVVSVYVKQLLNILETSKTSISENLKNNLLSICFNPSFQPSQLPYFYRLLSQCDVNLSLQHRSKLLQAQKNCLNPEVKVAIYELLNQTSLFDIVQRFTDPQQLTLLRGAVAQSIEQYNPQYDVVYIRLLQDQDHEIRKQTAHRLSIAMKIPQLNQTKIKQRIFSKTNQRLLIAQDIDTVIKKKNFQQQRIFSYDKANRYRCDIYNIIAVSKLFTLEQVKQFEAFDIELQQNIKSYGKSIFSRNEYQFQLILKGLIYRLKTNKQSKQTLLQKVKEIDPILTSVIKQF